MKIFSKCVKCAGELKSSTLHDTRLEHVMKKGEFIKQKCMECNTQNKTHIDEYKARPSKLIAKGALAIMVIGISLSISIFLWLLMNKNVIAVAYGMFGIPVAAYWALLHYDRNRVRNFNSLYIKKDLKVYSNASKTID